MNLRLPRPLLIIAIIVIAFLIGHAASLLAQPATASAPTASRWSAIGRPHAHHEAVYFGLVR